MKEISKYAQLLSGILAFVLTTSAILFAVLGLMYPGDNSGQADTYFFSVSIVLICIALLFIIGLSSLKKHQKRGINLLILGSILFIIACSLPAFQLILTVKVASTQLLFGATTLLLYLPFGWLIVYLWKFKKHQT